MRRFLDVLFQHLRWLALWLLVVPLVLGAAGFWHGGSPVVTARIRVDPAGFVGDAVADVLPPGNAPASSAAALITQLLQTDWYSARLLAAAGPSPSARRSPEQRQAELDTLQSHLRAAAEGTSLVSLEDAADRPQRGMALLNALLGTVGDALQAVEGQKAAAALQVASGELEKARDEMQRSIDEASRYAYTAGEVGDELQRDPTYLKLMATVGMATGHVQALSSLTEQARDISAAIPGVRRQLAVVVDAPRVEPTARVANATRSWLLALAGALPAGLLVVYLIALHEPRLRTLDDLREGLPTALLVSIPAEGDRPPPA